MTPKSFIALVHNRQMRFQITLIKFHPPRYSGPSDIIQATNTVLLRTPTVGIALTTPAADMHEVGSIAYPEPWTLLRE